MVSEHREDEDLRQRRDTELVAALLPLWHATREWAEALLCRSFSLASAPDILSPPYRGRHRIPGTRWFYRTHGSGVDLDLGIESGGIDFDFDHAEPDAWRLRIFATKQLNAGALHAEDYWELVDDEGRFNSAFERIQKHGRRAD